MDIEDAAFPEGDDNEVGPMAGKVEVTEPLRNGFVFVSVREGHVVVISRLFA